MKGDSFHRWLALRLSRVTPQVVQICEDIRLLVGTGCDLMVRPRVGPAAGCGRAVLVSLKMSHHRDRPRFSGRTKSPKDAIMWWMHSELAYQLDYIRRCGYANVGYHAVLPMRLVNDEGHEFHTHAKGRMYQKHGCSASEVMRRLCQMSTAVLLRA